MEYFYEMKPDYREALWGIFIAFSLYTVADYLNIVGPKPFSGIPMIPHFPIVGNVFQIQKHSTKVFLKWQRQYKSNIYQIRLGNHFVVIVNLFKDISELWKKSSMNSRPMQYTFHNLVSSTKGFTIGTTPFSQTYKKRKQVISQALNTKNIKRLIPLIDTETEYTVKQILKSSSTLAFQPSTNPHIVHSDMSFFKNFQYFSLRSSILITYGFKLDCYGKDKELADTIIDCESKIIRFRSPVSNYTDYFPFLRYIMPFDITQTTRAIRDDYMEQLYQRRDSTSSEKVNLIRDYYEITNPKKIDYTEIQSISLTMLSAGLDNTPLNLDHLFGHLSNHIRGTYYQEMVIFQLLSLYKTPTEAYQRVAIETECAMAVALIKETLRYFTVLPIGLPRSTTNDIKYKNMIIPKGTTLVMNAYAANHDPKQFEHPNEFMPERWLDSCLQLKSEKIISHVSFGKGVRMCSGNILAFKEMYVLLCRLLLCFRIRAPRDPTTMMNGNPFKQNGNPRGTTFDPKPFKYQIQPRKVQGCDDLYNYIAR